MRTVLVTSFLCLFACSAGDVPARELAPLPAAVTNNAVVSVRTAEREYVISFSGLGSGKTHEDTTSVTYVFDGQEWRTAGPVPGDVGRLASVATSAGGIAYVFGGYTVAEDGGEVSTPWVHAFDPVTGTFEERTPMPVPVDDAIAVTWEDRYIYLVSGWHDFGNVNLVQRYDTREDSWVQATPTPGRAVFGHAGGIVGDIIVYCDGVAIESHADRRREFVANGECFAGIIDLQDSRRIDWRTVAPHPGGARYRMAAVGVEELNAVVFIGGSENPYNYNGIGYNGEPSRPARGVLVYDVSEGSWSVRETPATPSMDHRGLVRFDGDWLTVGGMLDGQQVTDRVVVYALD